MPRSSERILGFEERALSLVLTVLGTVAVGVGLTSPRDHSTELVLGGLLVVVGVWTFFADAASPVIGERPRS